MDYKNTSLQSIAALFAKSVMATAYHPVNGLLYTRDECVFESFKGHALYMAHDSSKRSAYMVMNQRGKFAFFLRNPARLLAEGDLFGNTNDAILFFKEVMRDTKTLN